MNCLKTYPNLLKGVHPIRQDYTYSFLDILKEYNLEPDIIYGYLLSIEEFKLRNIWNHTIKKWNMMKSDLNDNNNFIKSDYYKNEYHQIHTNMNDEKLNELLSNFIDGHHLKCFFCCNSILNYITVK